MGEVWPSAYITELCLHSLPADRDERQAVELRPNSITLILGQSPRQVPDKVADLSRTQIAKVGDVICVADIQDLCPRLCRELVLDFIVDFVAGFPRAF